MRCKAETGLPGDGPEAGTRPGPGRSLEVHPMPPSVPMQAICPSMSWFPWPCGLTVKRGLDGQADDADPEKRNATFV